MTETTPGSTRPIRFASGAPWIDDPEKIASVARRGEELGFSTFVVADHFSQPFAPLMVLQLAAQATRTLRLGQLVLDHDFRHPAMVAKELATLDVVSGGRVEIGVGAGWMRDEYDQAGIAFDPPSVRIARLEEYVTVLQGLFADGPFSFSGEHYTVSALDGSPKPVQRPRPPIMIGGGGPKLLAVAGRRADIVHVTPGTVGGPGSGPRFGAEAFAEKIDWVRDSAGSRFPNIELAVQLMDVNITDDRGAALDAFRARLGASAGAADVTDDEILASPVVLIGALDDVCAKLVETRATLGVTYYISAVGGNPKALAPVIERVTGV
jgi:probable F420-dependent oxidoreductase